MPAGQRQVLLFDVAVPAVFEPFKLQRVGIWGAVGGLVSVQKLLPWPVS